jgi:citrate lyase subunit beta/citryl-CoA lyase
VLAASALAARPDVVALAWGADDLVASLGGTSSRRADTTYRDVARHARSAVLLAAGAAGKAAIDAVHLDLDDLDGLRAEALDAAAVGFAASLCVHPGQVPVIRAAYAPSDDEVSGARELLDAAARTPGVFTQNGRMVDGPLVKQAQAVLRRARATTTAHDDGGRS